MTQEQRKTDKRILLQIHVSHIWQTRDSFVYRPDKGAAKNCPKDIPELDSVFRSFSNQGILAQTKISVMQQAVAKYPKLSISSKGLQIPSRLDPGSEVSLICQSYFKEHLLSRMETPMGEKADSHLLFNLMLANDGQLPVKTYTEIDINFWS